MVLTQLSKFTNPGKTADRKLEALQEFTRKSKEVKESR